ncbi:MAG: hypothetical protein KGI70_02395 [Patescibacteria group bacterium]|nr:hypothetical protein [Patescibacteria group bacterium]
MRKLVAAFVLLLFLAHPAVAEDTIVCSDQAVAQGLIEGVKDWINMSERWGTADRYVTSIRAAFRAGLFDWALGPTGASCTYARRPAAARGPWMRRTIVNLNASTLQIVLYRSKHLTWSPRVGHYEWIVIITTWRNT